MTNAGFSIDGLGAQGMVVEYVCNYTSLSTNMTLQVRLQASEVNDVRIEQVGVYRVQVGALSLLIDDGIC